LIAARLWSSRGCRLWCQELRMLFFCTSILASLSTAVLRCAELPVRPAAANGGAQTVS
jgi:hypothetical protein